MARHKNSTELVCRWTLDEHDGSYDTDCGQKFQFIDGGPKENLIRFCCYCGLKLRPVGSSASE